MNCEQDKQMHCTLERHMAYSNFLARVRQCTKKEGKLRRDILRRELETLQVSIEDLKISCIG